MCIDPQWVRFVAHSTRIPALSDEFREVDVLAPVAVSGAVGYGGAMVRIAVTESGMGEHVDWMLSRPHMAMGMGALSEAVYGNTQLPLREREAARYTIALINDCKVCRATRTKEAASDAAAAAAIVSDTAASSAVASASNDAALSAAAASAAAASAAASAAAASAAAASATADASHDAASKPAADESFYGEIANWRVSATLNEREKLAAEFAQRFALDHLAMDDEFWARLRSAFADDEITDLTISCGMWLGMGRALAVMDVPAPAETLLV